MGISKPRLRELIWSMVEHTHDAQDREDLESMSNAELIVILSDLIESNE